MTPKKAQESGIGGRIAGALVLFIILCGLALLIVPNYGADRASSEATALRRARDQAKVVLIELHRAEAALGANQPKTAQVHLKKVGSGLAKIVAESSTALAHQTE